MTATSHLFSDVAQSYAVYRPTYPPALYEQIYRYLGSDRPFHLVIDAATGSGQAAVTLAEKFEQVLAFDPSANQVAKALQKPNITYKVGSAEDIDAPDSSADLITVASALHWFDVEKFLGEANRVLRPKGAIAIWGYRRPLIVDNEEADRLLVRFMDSLRSYWNDRILMVFDENGAYASVQIDSHLFEEETRVQIPLHLTWPVKHFVGYITTWSSHATYRRENPEKEDPLAAFRNSLLQLLGTDDDNTDIKICFDNTLILAKAKK